MKCIDLQKRFGKRYRIEYEESYRAERGKSARAAAPWLAIIPCKRGHIFPWGGDKLAASTNNSGPTARKLKALAFVTVVQDGDDGITVTFPVERFPEVAKLMKPRRRRRLSPEAGRAAAGRLAEYRFRAAVRAPQNECRSTQTVMVGI